MKRLAPGDVSGHTASAFREGKDKPENRVVASPPESGETTAVTTRRSIARRRNAVKSAVLDCVAGA